MIPTFLGIMIVNFAIIQFAPGGPVEQVIAQMEGIDSNATNRLTGSSGGEIQQSGQGGDSGEGGAYRGRRGLDPDLVADLERQFGLDKPMHERFITMIGNYIRFDFGESFYRDISVIDLVIEKLPVSISLGIWTTLLTYLISIPLGIKKALNDGTPFDVWTSGIVIIGNAIPGFLFAVLLIVLFAGGTYFDLFPLRGLVSDNWDELNWFEKILDYFWHLALPLLALMVGAFATLTMLTKNSFMEEINKQYVLTAKAKGLAPNAVLYGHVFRNAMLIIIAGFPAMLVGVLFTGSMLIEIIFSLDGIGLLGYESVINRDYPVVFATLYVFTLIGLVLQIVSDVVKTIVDPRLDFEREGN